MTRLYFIGGTSHAGKSTLARKGGERLGCEVISTDSLGRHPGRPWSVAGVPVKPHVAAYYRDLSTADQLADVLVHYEEVIWPEVLKCVESAEGPMILEGSALLPRLVATLDPASLKVVWLRVAPGELELRIKVESGFEERGPEERLLIERFIARAGAFQTWLDQDLERAGLSPGDPALFGLE